VASRQPRFSGTAPRNFHLGLGPPIAQGGAGRRESPAASRGEALVGGPENEVAQKLKQFMDIVGRF